ncbi:quercetin 2,3-dioxygenase [Acidihalobacter aeolianus]|uniref:Quercetin 2,3-dioxygenase n=1 Tax=Acidihalobacter aeolianus TaxID=2792603 RepID=A0A1D8K5Q3_9GAMM|nr:pirin family protein [Acidihalobacter aeolianus]AOV16274.1 quercetin 2,3-dioxygenase [Acidihalobacter aeolianus]
MTDTSTRHIGRIVEGMDASDGAGVRLKRYIARPGLEDIDPFLLLDEFRTERADDYIAGFPPHPHRGFETVTYMVHGRMRHRDSTGMEGLLTPGAVQWMTAGRGIIHSEMPEMESGLMWGYQLWVNLPARLKMHPPRYQDIAPERIPAIEDGDARVRVIAGRHADTDGAAETLTDIVYLDVELGPEGRFTRAEPSGYAGFLILLEGDLHDTAGTSVRRGQLAVVSGEGKLSLQAGVEGARFLYAAGAPLDEPIVRYGPFVMNTQTEIRQAFEDYQSGRLATP